MVDPLRFLLSVPSLTMSDPLLCPRSLLAVRSDPNRPRLYLIHRQINDHINLATSYASFAHRLKLDHSKHVRLFSDLSHNLSNLISSFPPPLQSDSSPGHPVIDISNSDLCYLERQVKERIRITRQLVSEAKESFDNHKIQKLKDTIFFVNEQLTKAKKSGAFSSLIADKINLGEMQVMFRKDYNGVHIEVMAVEDYTFLNSSYVSVLRQLKSTKLLEFFFQNKMENATKDTTHMVS
ncbi:Galacturonosyltransferase 8 [Acorus calamus]|uniref:Galacturonosyltransferase 8 n=1 Tax=Acorus calamus TaxID=4465 RepID=A0AAV9EYY2_ACOCL|nr:Galacturonosyltransferase 8 [Acorus calamus]